MSLIIAQGSDIHSEIFDMMNHNVRKNFIQKFQKLCVQIKPDVLALPGDLAQGSRVVKFIDSLLPPVEKARIPYIVFVTGNHEYHECAKGKRSIDQTNNNIRSSVESWNKKKDNRNRKMVFLDNSSFDITHDGTKYRFSGGTLWTDMNLLGNQKKQIEFFKGRQDEYIGTLNRKCTGILDPTETIERHKETLEYIRRTVSQTDDIPDVDVVMTHHQPTLKTTLPIYRNHPSNPSVSSNLDNFIIDSRISLWMAGHSHNANSVFIGNTFVSNNTYGYGKERNAENKLKSGKLDIDNKLLKVIELEKYNDNVVIKL